MKLSFCAHNFGSNLEEVRKGLLSLAEIGYKGTEFWQQFLVQADLGALRDAVQQAGLTVAQICAYFNWTGTKEEWHESIESARRFVSYSAKLGKPFIRVFTGKIGSAKASSQQWEACVRGLGEACDMAAEEGIGLNLESHTNTLHDSPHSTLRLIAYLGRPNIGINFQPWDGFDPVESLRLVYPYVRHVHVSNRKAGRICELAEGDFPWPAMVSELKSRGYAGFLSVEHALQPALDFARRSYKFMKGIMGDSES